MKKKKSRESKSDGCMKKKKKTIVYLYSAITIYLNFEHVRETKMIRSSISPIHSLLTPSQKQQVLLDRYLLFNMILSHNCT